VQQYLDGERVFDGCSLRNARLIGAHLKEADLTNADLSGADLTRSSLKGANQTGANLTGANLSFSNLKESKPGALNLRVLPSMGNGISVPMGPASARKGPKGLASEESPATLVGSGAGGTHTPSRLTAPAWSGALGPRRPLRKRGPSSDSGRSKDYAQSRLLGGSVNGAAE
jgi:hypothetical protein